MLCSVAEKCHICVYIKIMESGRVSVNTHICFTSRNMTLPQLPEVLYVIKIIYCCLENVCYTVNTFLIYMVQKE